MVGASENPRAYGIQFGERHTNDKTDEKIRMGLRMHHKAANWLYEHPYHLVGALCFGSLRRSSFIVFAAMLVVRKNVPPDTELESQVYNTCLQRINTNGVMDSRSFEAVDDAQRRNECRVVCSA